MDRIVHGVTELDMTERLSLPRTVAATYWGLMNELLSSSSTPGKNKQKPYNQGIGENDNFHHNLLLWAIATGAIPA